MERKDNRSINREFKTALFLWHSSPENPTAAKKINDLIALTYEVGANFTFKIDAEILKNSEASRAILINDLKTMAKREGDQLVFNLRPKKDGKYKLKVVKDYLVIADKKYGKLVPGAFFRHNEVISFEAN